MAHYKELREPLSDNNASDAAPQSTGQMIQDLISLVRYERFSDFFPSGGPLPGGALSPTCSLQIMCVSCIYVYVFLYEIP
jgi:hypothetical protein